MKQVLRWASLFIVLSLLLTSFATFAIEASAETATDDATVGNQKKTQKIVTVVYDDSGSMNININDTSSRASPTRADYALYSIKMLISLLGEGDVLQIVPMNKSPRSFTLVGSDRQRQMDEIVASGIFNPSGGTPIASIDDALDQLVSQGLKDASMLTTQDENKDFWLFVLTDGKFTDNNNREISEANTPGEITGRIDKYPSLKTIYFAFSDAATDLKGTSFESELSTAYKAANGEDLVKGMQDIATQLSGRYYFRDYTINGDKNATVGDTLVIDLNKSMFPLKNLSIVALNCGATITSVSYQPKGSSSSNDRMGSITQACIIEPANIPGIVAGYSAVIDGSPYFSGGTLTIKFSKPISKEFLSIFAEPALALYPTFKVKDSSGQLISVDSDYITGGKVSKGEKLFVGYVCKAVDGKTIDIASAFGSEVSASVTYAGVAKNIPTGSSETDITLVEGPNNITITVNVKDVNYKMYTSVNCNVLADQSSYRVTASHDTAGFSKSGSAVASYKVYVDNVEKSPSQLKSMGFTWYIETTLPDGRTVRVDNPEKNGAIAYNVEAKSGLDGDYKVYFKVVSTLGWRMDETTYSYSVDFGSVEIRTRSPETLKKGTNKAQVEFTAHYMDAQLDKIALQNYDTTAKVISNDGTEYDVAPNITNDGRILVDVAIDPDVYGEYSITVQLASKTSDLKKEYTHVYKIYPSSVTIKGEHEDAFPTGVTKTSAKYKIIVDGAQLTREELNRYTWSIITYLPGGTGEYPTTVSVDEDGTVNLEYDVAGSQFGAYETRLEIVFSRNYTETYSNMVKNVPTSTTINVIEGQGLSITQNELTINTSPIKFEMFSDGLPLVFNNGMTTFKVTVGGVDVTQYATTDGNALIYVPHADHFAEELPLGTHTVTLSVRSDEFASLNASASSDFGVTRTIYEIISLTNTNKSVERFHLKNMDTAIHFQILRDGVPLPLDELTAAYEAGEIALFDESGVFSWMFWYPCGNEITVKEADGQPVLEYRITRDFKLLGLDKVMAMFFITGDKPVSITYKDVSAVDAIAMQRGEVLTYLIIWFIIFLIIHIILFLIGFINGKCKNLPSGVFVSVPMLGKLAAMREFNVDKKVNLSFSDKWKWHLGRLFLYGCFKRKRLWYHQPDVKYSQYSATLGYDKNGDLGLTIKADDIYKQEENRNAPASKMFREFKDKCTTYNGKRDKPSLELPVKDLKQIFKMQVGTVSVRPDEFLLRYNGAYAEINRRKGEIASVMMFIERI